MKDHVTPRERLNLSWWRSLLLSLRRSRRLHFLGEPRVVRDSDGLDYIRFRGLQ